MSVKVKRLTVNSLFGYKNAQLEMFPETTVLVGNNGSGKSTLLKILRSLLTNTESQELKHCVSAICELDNGMVIRYENSTIRSEKAYIKEIVNRLVSEVNDVSNLIDVKSSFSDLDKKIENIMKDSEKHYFSVRREGKIVPRKDYLKFAEKNINIEYISTIDLSAISRFSYISAEGAESNILNDNIKAELEMLLSCKDLKLQRAFSRVVNQYLIDSNKKINRRSDGFIVHCKYSGGIPIESLSSGERQLIYILLKTANSCVRNTIMLMDEPEISLHLNWQERLIDSIREINPECQLIIVTHSPGIVMKGYRDIFIDVKDIVTGN
ncbi:AAA family ATPase [Klebsiella aerogenes]